MWPAAVVGIEQTYVSYSWEPTVFSMESLYFFEKLPTKPDVKVCLVPCCERGELGTRIFGQGRKEHCPCQWPSDIESVSRLCLLTSIDADCCKVYRPARN